MIEETKPGEARVLYTSYKDATPVSTREFSPLEFLAEASQHIPGQWEQTTATGEVEPKEKASRKWAACMKKIFEVDPLQCPRCGETMAIKAFLHYSKEIERICKNLGLSPWRAPPRQ